MGGSAEPSEQSKYEDVDRGEAGHDTITPCGLPSFFSGGDGMCLCVRVFVRACVCVWISHVH